ncbi:hypothetical protein PS15p_205938 [Mucor circinelloides]
MRYGSPLKGQHCLLPPLFRSVDEFYVEASWDNCSLSPNTLLQMPFLELCHQATTDTSFLNHKLIRMKPAHTLLENSRLHDSLVFKARASCPNPGFLMKIITVVVRSSTINFVPSLPCVYRSAPLGPDSLSVTDEGFDLLLYFRHKLFYQGIMILSMSNTELRAMYMRNHPPITNRQVDVNRLTVASFLDTKMLSAARNLWFRLIHNKVSSKVNVSHIIRLPDDL